MVAVFLFMLVDLLLHFVQRLVERRASVFTFDVCHNRVITVDFNKHFDSDTRAFKFDRDVNFADGVEILDELFSFAGDNPWAGTLPCCSARRAS